MVLKTIGKFAAVLALSAALTGCIDATVDVELTSDTTARATLTQVMGADFYAMIKMNAEDAEAGAEVESFCAEGDLTEEADGSATCVVTEQGDFASLTDLGDGDEAMSFTPAGPGLVRVALPTANMTSEVGGGEDMDAETKQMIEAFFAGRTVTVRIAGAEIADTNMKRSEDGKSAEMVLPFLDLLNGTADLPAELYAVVRAP